jgi:ketosteroid isomerase-like protein
MIDSWHSKQLARSFLESINRGDHARLRELLADDVLWVVPKSAVPPYAGEHRGAEHVIDLMLSAVATSFDATGVRYEVRLALAEDDWVMLETVMRGVHVDGRHYENEYVFLLRLSGDCIAEIREHVDTAYAVRFFSQEPTV